MSISNPLVAGSSPAGRAENNADSLNQNNEPGPPVAHPLQDCNSTIADIDAIDAALIRALDTATAERHDPIRERVSR